ncbi:MAG: YicC/YloC family endoribonuclease [Halieaceae bacterium]|jgi:uncharacterized protein (TIGR00255 family)|nr:YicC/YloC family endoribonuclease [Halieaceae bacterium]
MSVHSMTAFAREASRAGDDVDAAVSTTIVVELRSVNHRYLDCHFKLPDALRALEPQLREALSQGLSRGKIDCQIRLDSDGAGNTLRVNRERLAEVAAAAAVVHECFDKVAKVSALEVLQFPGVCEGSAQDEDQLFTAARETFDAALASLRETRAREGAQLRRFLSSRLDSIAGEIERLRELLPELRRGQEERLRARLGELEQPVDEGRIEQELVLLLHKADVDEELDRLSTHIDEVGRVLERGGPCGRRLDFLMQELNREANTIASKASASRTTQGAVELKVLIEQMREQVQNIE